MLIMAILYRDTRLPFFLPMATVPRLSVIRQRPHTHTHRERKRDRQTDVYVEKTRMATAMKSASGTRIAPDAKPIT